MNSSNNNVVPIYVSRLEGENMQGSKFHIHLCVCHLESMWIKNADCRINVTSQEYLLNQQIWGQIEKKDNASSQIHSSVVIQTAGETCLIKFCGIIIDILLWKPRWQCNWIMGWTPKPHWFRYTKWTWFSRYQKFLYYPCSVNTLKLLFCLSRFLQQSIAHL